MRKLLIVLGPTAVGKTALSVNLAKEFNGHIISADSIQVYKGLDIISGKDRDFYESIPVSLLDITTPFTPFNISDYLFSLENVLPQIPLDSLPIIVGGSAYYINALLNPIDTVDIQPDKALRSELEMLSVEDLQNRLKKLDSDKLNSMNESDISNPRRLVRAIEVASALPIVTLNSFQGLNKIPKQVRDDNFLARDDSVVFPLAGFDVKIIGLTADKEVLDKRVDARVTQRIEQGAVDEAKALFKNYDLLAPQVKTASGYKQLFEYLSGMYTWEACIKNWKIAEHQNVRKQLTWFKKFKNVNWFDITDEKYREKAENLVSSWFEE